MDEKEQLATMLLENMQRSDLTVLEQANGFQMMMDLGETVSDISSKTGFSESTVRRRFRLLELDQDRLRAAEERGGMLNDYIELEKIKDPALKNKVLDKIGTSNFEWELKNAIETEKARVRKAELITELEDFAVLVDSSAGLCYVEGYYLKSKVSFKKPDDTDTVKYFYRADDNYVYLYREVDTAQADNTREAERQKENEKRERLRDVSERAYNLRYEFVKGFTNTKKYAQDIIEFAVRNIIDGYGANEENIADLLDIKLPNDADDVTLDTFADALSISPEKVLLATAYAAIDGSSENYYHYNNSHIKNVDLDLVYELLGRLGYQMSDEEKALQDGTHELFAV